MFSSNRQRLNTAWAVAGALVLIIGWSIFLLDEPTIIRLTGEDGPVEYLGMFCWFAASLACFITFFRSERDDNSAEWLPDRNWIYFILGLLFLFAGGEEVSWGQRIFGFDTPEGMRDINMQSEFNIHNLPIFHALDEDYGKKTGLARWLTMERMFAVFWLSYCFLLPIATSLLSFVQKLADYFGVPVPPLAIGSMFMINYGISKALEFGMKESPQLHWPSVETKESLFAVLFLLVGLYFLRSYSRE